ncbi:hypothetical protein ACFQX6_45520 [Streptosporangium lutulentum]
MQCDVVLSSTTGHRMVIFRPQPGSTTAENFEFLDVLGRRRSKADRLRRVLPPRSELVTQRRSVGLIR